MFDCSWALLVKWNFTTFTELSSMDMNDFFYLWETVRKLGYFDEPRP